MYNYIVSAQKPTSVTKVLKGNFTSNTDLNLIVFKSTRIEVHLLTPDGLLPQADLGIYGRIETAFLFRPSGSSKDLLFVSTEKMRFFVLSYDPQTETVVTKANGDVRDKIGKSEDVHLGIVDPDCRMIGLHLYTGFFKVIPMDVRGTLKEAFNVRLEELQVLDIQFLHGCQKPTLAVLYEDMKHSRHIKTYEVLLKNKDLAEGPWSRMNVDPGMEMLVPIPSPYGGLLELGVDSIAYSGGSHWGSHVAIPLHCGLIRTVAQIDEDGLRWLLGDGYGSLHVLALQVSEHDPNSVTGLDVSAAYKPSVPRNPTAVAGNSSADAGASSSHPAAGESKRITNISMEYLGETSIASSIAYLDNGVVFIASTGGDSQLIRLLETKDDETNSYVEVLESFTNLGPILDFCVMDLDRQGQGQVVTCSGVLKDGSLRVIRNGIGIDEQAAVELPGIKGIWSLRKTFDAEHDTYLVQSFIGETRILAIEDEEMGEFELPGFKMGCQTIYCGNMVGDLLVQVEATGIRLVHQGQVVSQWTPSGEDHITVASGNPTQLLVAIGGGKLVYFEVDSGNQLVEKATTALEYEISCIDITPMKPQHADASTADNSGDGNSMDVDGTMAKKQASQPLSASFAAVGMWTDFTIRVLELPSLMGLHKEELGGETIPRSILFASFSSGNHLVCGLGDGQLFVFAVHQHDAAGAARISLSDRRKSSLGTQPISLSTFKAQDEVNVFASSDRPTVIYSNGDKLLYSHVNLKEVSLMTPFNSESFPDCLALATEEELKIGNINAIQKLHIRTMHLGEQPRRIEHHTSSKSLALLTARYGLPSASDTLGDTIPSNGGNRDDYTETCYVRLFDDQTFDLMDSYQLDEFEHGTSILCCTFADEASEETANAGATTNNSDSNTATDNITGASISATPPSAPESPKGRKSSKEFIVVGTSYVVDDEDEPTKGRILVFEVTNPAQRNGDEPGEGSPTVHRKLNLVTEKVTRGAVYTLDAFQGKFLAGINAKIQLFKFIAKDGSAELISECGHHGHVLALYVKSRGDFIVVGDLMKSISLLMYRALDGSIEEIARDYNANWMSAIGILDNDTYIGAEISSNIFTVQRNSGATTDDERGRLQVVGEFHLGESVNKFCEGSLVMKNTPQSTDASGDLVQDTSKAVYPTPFSETSFAEPRMLFGTIDGVIGVVASLNGPQFRFLKRLQKAINTVVKGIGGLDHAEWRTCEHKKSGGADGFIDGDLVESFLDLKKQDMERVVQCFNDEIVLASSSNGVTSITNPDGKKKATSMQPLSVNEIVKVVEELSRMH